MNATSMPARSIRSRYCGTVRPSMICWSAPILPPRKPSYHFGRKARTSGVCRLITMSMAPDTAYLQGAPRRGAGEVWLPPLPDGRPLLGEGTRSFAGILGEGDQGGQVDFQPEPLVERDVQPLVDRLLDQARGDRRPLGDLARQRHGGVHELLGRHYLV